MIDMPDNELLRLAQAIVDGPADERTVEQWASDLAEQLAQWDD